MKPIVLIIADASEVATVCSYFNDWEVLTLTTECLLKSDFNATPYKTAQFVVISDIMALKSSTRIPTQTTIMSSSLVDLYSTLNAKYLICIPSVNKNGKHNESYVKIWENHYKTLYLKTLYFNNTPTAGNKTINLMSIGIPKDIGFLQEESDETKSSRPYEITRYFRCIEQNAARLLLIEAAKYVYGQLCPVMESPIIFNNDFVNHVPGLLLPPESAVQPLDESAPDLIVVIRAAPDLMALNTLACLNDNKKKASLREYDKAIEANLAILTRRMELLRQQT